MQSTIIITVICTILWICIGAFINYKRNYYVHLHSDFTGDKLESAKFDAVMICFINYLFAPLTIIVAIISEITKPWNNK